ncbi:MAG TPA: efflux RND transporter periplasmic adaptor subunit [Polyangiaceae bacterium]|nr:efflux RND transporter periplasmic adaptor subunit [Polyangiaceae bacterium]
MIRRLLPWLAAASVLGVFAWTLLFLYQRSEAKPVVHATSLPEKRDVVKKTVAPGAIIPRREVVIKPRVSGIVEKLYVEPGQLVKERELLARIQIVPNGVALNQAEAAVRAAKISFTTAQSELVRFKAMRTESVVAESELIERELAFRLREQEVETADANLQIIRSGASKRSGVVSNLVYSTVAGMVLEVPIKEGGSVIEANNFNEGTTIAAIADMTDMIFAGRVDESEVGRLSVGMPVAISVGAFPDRTFAGTLEHIAPKGLEKNGTIEFAIKATIELKEDVFVRANYSANADVILDRRDGVLAVNEAWLAMSGGKAFAEVETTPQHFERRELKLGLSDGIWTEVVSGLGAADRLKHQDGPR